MVRSSTLKMESGTRYSDIPLLSPGPHSVTYQNTTINFRCHTLTDISLFLHVANYGASNPFTAQFMLCCAVYFGRWVVERDEKNQIDFGIVLF